MKAQQDNSPVKCRDGVDEMTKVDIERVMGFAASTRIPTDDIGSRISESFELHV